MVRGLKKFVKANNFPWITFKRYWKYAARSELIVDVLLPVLLAVTLIQYAWITADNFTTVITRYKEISAHVIAAIAILAGFNITSITVIATLNNASTQKLKNEKSKDERISLYGMLIVFFTWAVIVQLFVVLISIAMYYLGSFVQDKVDSLTTPIWVWVLMTSWITIVFHSIFISIRNMKTLFLYVTYKED